MRTALRPEFPVKQGNNRDFLDLDLNHADPASKSPGSPKIFWANSLLGGTGNFETRTGDSF